jgi:hypothetical protein
MITRTFSFPSPQPASSKTSMGRCFRKPCVRTLFYSAFAITLLTFVSASAQVSGAGQRPDLGWSTFSEQTISSGFLTRANVAAESDALASTGLQADGFQYINIDSGWQGSFDANGRPIPNTSTFPDITALVNHIHQNGQKAGIYWIPGVEYPAVVANSPILGTPYHIQDILVVPYTAGNAFGAPGASPYHYKIDFTKPGAQERVAVRPKLAVLFGRVYAVDLCLHLCNGTDWIEDSHFRPKIGNEAF